MSTPALWDIQPLLQWVQGNSQGMNLTIHLHLTQRSKNEQSYTSVPSVCIHGKHRSNVTFYVLTKRAIYAKPLGINVFRKFGTYNSEFANPASS